MKELTATAVGIFLVLLAVMASTQAINLLGRAANGRVAVDAVLALIGFWTLGMTPVLLVLTAYVSVLTVLTRYWRDSEMLIWLASGLSLKQWIMPVMRFALPFALLVALLQLWIIPVAELQSREFAEILKQKQELSLVQEGTFQSIGKNNSRVYFVDKFDTDSGVMKNLFLREQGKDGRDSVVFAKEGSFSLKDNKRTLELSNGYRYNGEAGKGDFNQVSFQHLSLIISTTPKVVSSDDNRHTLATADLLGSSKPLYRAELMWRLSFPISILILSLVAIPLSYFNPRSGHTYNILFAIGFFLIYQNGLTFLRNAIEDGKINFWFGFFPIHIIMFIVAVLLLRVRSMPTQPFWQALKHSVKGGA